MRLHLAVMSVLLGLAGLGACRVPDSGLIVPPSQDVTAVADAEAFVAAGRDGRSKPSSTPAASPLRVPSPSPPLVPGPATLARATPGPSVGPVSAGGDVEAAIVRLANDYRAQNGIPPLATAAALMAFARARSEDMAARQYFSHTTPDGLSVFDLLRKAGIGFAAARENIGWNKGYAADQVAQVAMDGWIASSGHRANLVATDVTKLGVGAAQAADGAWYLTQVFSD